MSSSTQQTKIENISHVESGLYSLMVGMGEAFFAPVVLLLGMGEIASGNVVIFPVVAASLVQIFWPLGMRLFGNAKNWVIACALFQSLLLIGLATCLWRGINPGIAIFYVTTLYWIAHFAAGPPWNTWITHLVPAKKRIPFFARRSQVHELAVMIGLLSAGIWLQYGKNLDSFALIFCLAGIFRLGSALCFYFHPAPEASVATSVPAQSSLLNWRVLLARPRVKELLFFFFFFQFAVQTAAPFFTAYMLKHLGYGYQEYAILVSAPFIARSFSYALAERYATRFGIEKVWGAGTLLVAPIPIVWILWPNYYFLLAMQLVAGFAWGWFEIGQTLNLIRRYPTENRSIILTLTNVIAAFGMLAGFEVGTYLWHLGATKLESYTWIMSTSTVLRTLACCMIPLIVVRSKKIRRVYYRVLSVRPGGGSIARPILHSEHGEEPGH